MLGLDLDRSETAKDVAGARWDCKVMSERTNKRPSLLDCHGASRCLLSVAKRGNPWNPTRARGNRRIFGSRSGGDLTLDILIFQPCTGDIRELRIHPLSSSRLEHLIPSSLCARSRSFIFKSTSHRLIRPLWFVSKPKIATHSQVLTFVVFSY